MRSLLVRALFSLPLNANFARQPLDPAVLLSARIFNLAVAPTLHEQPRSVFRKRMDDFGLRYNETGMSVGHKIARSRGGSNSGGNLFAQHTEDNEALGTTTATDKELFFYWRLELLSQFGIWSHHVNGWNRRHNHDSTHTVDAPQAHTEDPTAGE